MNYSCENAVKILTRTATAVTVPGTAEKVATETRVIYSSYLAGFSFEAGG